MALTTEDRFWDKVNKTSGCWLWVGATFPAGYGKFRFSGKAGYAHRYSLSLKEQLFDWLVVDHVCANKNCVNPSHLQQVSQSTNLKRGHDRK